MRLVARGRRISWRAREFAAVRSAEFAFINCGWQWEDDLLAAQINRLTKVMWNAQFRYAQHAQKKSVRAQKLPIVQKMYAQNS